MILVVIGTHRSRNLRKICTNDVEGKNNKISKWWKGWMDNFLIKYVLSENMPGTSSPQKSAEGTLSGCEKGTVW